MDAKSTDWRAGPNVCRCCLTEGCYKDISTEYFWMGKREVYAEMLSDTLNVTIAYSQSGGPNSNSRLICELCISRLRDASDFKRQVLECEKTFTQHLDATSSMLDELEVQVEQIDSDVKLERVKQEKRLSDDDFDDRCGFDDDDDDLDDQPLTKLASKIPKKETVDLLDLLDNTKATEKRKSSTRTKSVPAKKAKTVKKEPVKASASKVAAKTEKKKKELNPMFIARQNAKTMIEYTTAYPFKLPESTMVCVYCCDSYEDPARFREHMHVEHQDFKVRMAFAHVAEASVKVDCTDLKCRICFKTLSNLEHAADHLIKKHNKDLNPNHGLGMHPFKIYKDKYSCAVCTEKFSTLALLSKHTHTHFVQFTCDACGKSYTSLTSLHCHLRYNCGSESDKNNKNRCRKCRKPFTSITERMKHLEKSERCRQHVCNICGDRFITWNMKQKHLQETHDVPQKSYKCPECHIVFSKRDNLRMHFKTTHTNDYVECSYCEKRFDTDKNLKKHIVVHTGERNFICAVCSKAFPRRSTLRQHMWIHSEVKKHECKMCDKTFNQRASWRTHMKSRHPELGVI